jgi:hypothetical protein
MRLERYLRGDTSKGSEVEEVNKRFKNISSNK